MDSFLQNLIPSFSQDHPGWADAPFLARLTKAYTLTSADVQSTGSYPGMAVGMNVYAFTEQMFDTATGLPLDAPSGRQTVLNATSGEPQYSFALEVNNALLQVPGATPTGYANAGPYVEMRLKGVVGGSPVYEFAWAGVATIAELNSSSPNGSGYYDATTGHFSPSWAVGQNIWLLDAN